MEEWRNRCRTRRGFKIKGKTGEVIVLGDRKNIERRHFFSLCPQCCSIGNHSACAGCCMVFYCSKDCQKKDWKSHKILCKVLTSLRSKNVHIFHRNVGLQNQISYTLSQCLNRPLTQYESDLLVHPRLCMVCLSGHQDKLVNCKDCLCVAYCSEKCRLEDEALHESICSELYNLVSDHRVDLTSQSQISGYIHPPVGEYTPLQQDFDGLLKQHVRELVEEDSDESFISAQARKLSWELTCPATVLFAVEQVGLRCGRVDEQESLVVHLVGARKAEVELAKSWFMLPARLTKLRCLRLVLIGPELETIGGLNQFSLQENGCTITFHLEHMSYQAFVTSGRFSEPHLVAALNCGFIFYTDWDASLNSLVRGTGAPLVFTEYYQEDCLLNLAKLQEHCARDLDVLLNCIPNPFCSRMAARIPAGFSLRQFGRKNILMSNDFLCVVKIKQ